MLKISVVTPSYNQGQFLERTIQSVHESGYPNIEHIVIDGGSTDNSVEIIKKYESKLAYWISEKDRGQTDALNKGFARCTGDILCWLNSDDTFLPNALHLVAETAEKNPSDNFFFGDIYFIDADDKILAPKRYAPIRRANLLMEGMVCCQPATFWRKSLMDMENVHSLNVKWRCSMDWDLFCRMAPYANYKYINAFLATYRLHDASKTCTIADIAAGEMATQRTLYCDPVYPKWQQKLTIPLLRAERVLYHLSRFRLGYLWHAAMYRLRRIRQAT